MRDKLKTEAHFEKFFKERRWLLNDTINTFNEEKEYKRKLGLSYDIFLDSQHIAIAQYSVGDPIPDVRSAIIYCIDALGVFVNLGEQDQEHFLYGDGGGYSGGLDKWYRLLAWCILFDLPRDKTDIVLDYLSLQMRNPEQATDALANKMVKALGYPGQDETDHLLWPDAYEPLYQCFKKESYRNEQLKVFMTQWYKKMGDTYWYNNHKSRQDTYFGYWCFEAAAVAKILDIDDSELKDHPNYPYDARHST